MHLLYFLYGKKALKKVQIISMRIIDKAELIKGCLYFYTPIDSLNNHFIFKIAILYKNCKYN